MNLIFNSGKLCSNENRKKASVFQTLQQPRGKNCFNRVYFFPEFSRNAKKSEHLIVAFYNVSLAHMRIDFQEEVKKLLIIR